MTKEKIISLIKRAVIFIVVATIVSSFIKGGRFGWLDYERVRKNIKIGGKRVALPFTVNELGDDFDLEIEDIQILDDFDYVYGDITHNGKIVLSCSAKAVGNDKRNYLIDRIGVFSDPQAYDYTNPPEIDDKVIKKISIDGIKCGMSKAHILFKYGKPNYRDDFEIEGEEFGYSPKYGDVEFCPVEFEFDEFGELIYMMCEVE